MRKLLREMVTTTTNYISSSSISAGEFTTMASKTTKTNLWTIDQSLIATNGSIKAHSSQMNIKMQVSTTFSFLSTKLLLSIKPKTPQSICLMITTSFCR
jgi:hypothetical protein